MAGGQVADGIVQFLELGDAVFVHRRHEFAQDIILIDLPGRPPATVVGIESLDVLACRYRALLRSFDEGTQPPVQRFGTNPSPSAPSVDPRLLIADLGARLLNVAETILVNSQGGFHGSAGQSAELLAVLLKVLKRVQKGFEHAPDCRVRCQQLITLLHELSDLRLQGDQRVRIVGQTVDGNAQGSRTVKSRLQPLRSGLEARPVRDGRNGLGQRVDLAAVLAHPFQRRQVLHRFRFAGGLSVAPHALSHGRHGEQAFGPPGRHGPGPGGLEHIHIEMPPGLVPIARRQLALQLPMDRKEVERFARRVDHRWRLRIKREADTLAMCAQQRASHRRDGRQPVERQWRKVHLQTFANRPQPLLQGLCGLCQNNGRAHQVLLPGI